MNKPLYEQDFFRWSEQQAQALRERASIRRLLKGSPSLCGAAADLVAEAVQDARQIVERELTRRREKAPDFAALTYTEDQVLGDWLPD